MADSNDLPERRVKNLWAAVLAGGGLVIGIIVIARYNALVGLLIIAIALIGSGAFYRLNNQHHIQQKSDDNEADEFDH